MKKSIIFIVILVVIAAVVWVILSNQNNNAIIPEIDVQKIVESKGVEKDKTVGNLVIKGGTISSGNGISRLKATVTNNGSSSSDVKLKITITDTNGLVAYTTIEDIGVMDKGQIKELDIEINKEISNAFDVQYIVQ